MKRFILVLVGLVWLVGPVYAQSDSKLQKAQEAFEKYWAKYNSNDLIITHAAYGKSMESTIRYEVYENYDMKVAFRQKFDDDEDGGSLILVQGQVILFKDFQKEILALQKLDSAALQFQMFQKLVILSYLKGPDQVKRRGKLRLKEKKKNLRVNTMTSVLAFAAPWDAKGTCEVLKDEAVKCDIDFTSANPGNDDKIHINLSGTLRYDPGLTLLPDATDISQWTTEPIAMRENGELIHAWAKNLKKHYKTLGALRAYLKKQESQSQNKGGGHEEKDQGS